MAFASPIFLWYFLPLLLVGYWVLPARSRNALIAVASLLFYAWGAAATSGLLVGAIAVNYLSGLLLGQDQRSDRSRRIVLAVTVALDLGMLGIWKYAGFFTAQLGSASQSMGFGWSPVLELALPIGISFYTFHLISYIVDVYRRVSSAQRNVVQFVCYITLFPQLVAGPIVRYHEIESQLRDVRTRRFADFADGVPRFCHGLFKKVMIADTVAPVADAAFAASGGELTSTVAWLGAAAYTIQIYFDFSGYSDMAIGLGRMFGFQLPENFSRPYSASSITDFWRRWHMSLSRWFRDYLYVPLGGNRNSTATTYRNLSIVFLLTGLWHGANWTFIVWGAFHGALLILERAFGFDRAPTGLLALTARRAITLVLVMVGWVFFRAPSMSVAGGMLSAMFSPAGMALSDLVQAALTPQREVTLLAASLVVLLPAGFVVGRLLDDPARQDRLARSGRIAFAAVLGPLSALTVAAGSFSPFLYFQF